MGLIKRISFCIVFAEIIFFNVPAFGKWFGPVQIIDGGWGNSYGQFGIEHQDTSDLIPERFYLGLNGKVIIEDLPNGKTKVVDNGKISKDFNCIEDASENWNEECNIVGDYLLTNLDGNIWTKDDDKYRLTTAAGQLLAIFDKRPLELGIKTQRRRAESDNRYDTIVRYEDLTYHMILDGVWDNFVRDRNDYLFFYTTYAAKDLISGQDSSASYVVKYDPCGKKIGELNLPISEYEPPTQEELDMPTTTLRVRNEYGPPVIGPDGSVYCWKRTPDTYSILKWTWVDDPSDPQPGPDAPSNLKVTPSLDGLYLTWGASPQDPGCVDGYEVERATSANGVYSNVTTTDHSVLKYNDTGALPGSSYFYKVRAKSDGLYSPYTPVVSGAR